jgi:bifunctional DNase/RNase
MVQMQVYRLGVTERGEAVVILSDLEGTLMLPIWIGIFEANSIAMEIRGEKFDRPLTHDLFHDTLQSIGYAIERIEINRLEQGTFYALLWVTDGGAPVAMDARPSDALAMALRFGADIYVEAHVLDQVAIAPEVGDGDEDEDEAFQELMRRMSSGPGAAGTSDAADEDLPDDITPTEDAE